MCFKMIADKDLFDVVIFLFSFSISHVAFSQLRCVGGTVARGCEYRIFCFTEIAKKYICIVISYQAQGLKYMCMRHSSIFPL